MLLLLLWTVVAVSGLLDQLGIEDRSPSVYARVGAVAVALTLIHVTLEWKPLKGALRYMVSVHRAHMVGG